jgi:hypothetical protein
MKKGGKSKAKVLPYRVEGSDFYRLRMEAGFNSWLKLAAFLSVTVRTVQNWERWGAPPAVEKYLRLLAGDLSFIGREWEGWRITGGEFLEHGARRVTPGDMRAFFWMEQQIRHLEMDKKRLEDDLAAARAQLRFQAVLDASAHVDLP